MKLSNLPKTASKAKKRIGRGYGSGRGGHSATRGQKGQKARNKVGIFFEGTKFKKSLLKRLPLLRGKGKLKSRHSARLVVNLKYLNLFNPEEEVNLQTLQSKGILSKNLPEGDKVKILGDGEIRIPLTVYFPCSRNARRKIEEAGGKVMIEKLEIGSKKIEKEVAGKKESPERKTAQKLKKTKRRSSLTKTPKK